MSNTLSGSITSGITLTNGGSYQSPFTISADGTIDTAGNYGVYSDVSAATLVNEGAITATVYGVQLQGGGALTNSGTAASIYGQSNGVVIRSTPATLLNQGTIAANGSEAIYVQGGTITNATGATISSQNGDGIVGIYDIAVGPTTLFNDGTVTAAGYGVLFEGGGYVSNGLSASIYGASNGVAIFSTTATLYNQGTISTGDSSSIGSLIGDAVYMQGNGHITNAAGATIVSEHGTGIEGNAAGAAGTAVTLVNDGVIIAQADQAGRFVGVSLQGDGYITNGYGATIAGAVGAQANGYGSVLNEGTIIGSVSSTTYQYYQNGLVLAGTGTISNSTSGFIEGDHDGILLESVTVNNAGLIEAQQNDGIDATGNATITNSGTVESSNGIGIYLNVSGSVDNSGMITGLSSGIVASSAYMYNSLTGTIQSQYNGIDFTQGGTVYNAGSIGGGVDGGISLGSNGEVINGTTGYISGYSGPAIAGLTVTVLNAGTIGNSYHGIDLSTGSINNSASASIEGGGIGINVTNTLSTINNAGKIFSNNGIGISESAGGSIYNSLTGTIEGGNAGVLVQNGSSADTIVNAGTISGGNYAIYFENMAGNTLVVDPGAVFSGVVDGVNPGNLLELASGTSAGTLDTDSFSGFTTIDVDSGADWTLTGADGELADNVGAAGTVSLAANSTLNVTGNIGADQTIVFAGDHATLGVSVNSTIAGTIDLDTASGEFQTIDIAGLTYSSITLASFDSATDVLTLGYVGDPPETLNFNSPDAANYILEDDGAGGTDVVIPCFVTNTRILTTRGYMPVQNLCVGDRVVTVREDGPQSADIIWLGERTVDCESLAAPETAWPVLISRGALGHDMPVRDLLVSRDHCLMIDNVLIPAKLLVNGGSIRQVRRATVTYWHVELSNHDIMLAEGMPAESYLDTGNRIAFARTDAAPATPHHWSDTCLPIVFGHDAQAHLAAHLARQVEAVA